MQLKKKNRSHPEKEICQGTTVESLHLWWLSLHETPGIRLLRLLRTWPSQTPAADPEIVDVSTNGDVGVITRRQPNTGIPEVRYRACHHR